MPLLQGTPSDDAEAVLATGRTDVSTIFVSMSARHPEGRDAEYLAWHTLDHRPEQYRLASLRAAMSARTVTPGRADTVGRWSLVIGRWSVVVGHCLTPNDE